MAESYKEVTKKRVKKNVSFGQAHIEHHLTIQLLH